MIFAVISPEQLKLLLTTHELATQAGCSLMLVGGAVRDSYYNIPSNDFDLVVETGESERLLPHLSQYFKANVVVREQFLTAKLLMPEGETAVQELDFVTPRSECYPKPGSLPVVQRGSIFDDLNRRDFSINAVALRLSDLASVIEHGSVAELKRVALDPTCGVSDLESRIVRVLHDKSFLDDPTRIFRAFRYRGRIQGSFHSVTMALLDEARDSGVLALLSPHRRLLELRRVFQENNAREILKALADGDFIAATGLFPDGREGEFVDRFCAFTDISSEPEMFGLALWIVMYGENDGARLLKSAGITKKDLAKLKLIAAII